MKTILPILSFAILLISCATTKEAKIDKKETAKQHFENIAKDDSLFASIKRGVCYGTCPAYELKIYNNGYTVMTGSRNVPLIGKYSTTLTLEKMHAFINKANDIGYLKMNDVYDNKMVTDLPETTTSIVVKGKRKTVRRRYQYPKEILSFEELFDNLLTSEKWTKLDTDDSEGSKK